VLQWCRIFEFEGRVYLAADVSEDDGLVMVGELSESVSDIGVL